MARDRRDRRGSKSASGKPIKKGKRKYCQFCADKNRRIDYKDIALLRKFMSERGKIRARRVTGNCTQHQRLVATAIKNAREVALLPYSSR
jgi:small subunit ribosomal protein S18